MAISDVSSSICKCLEFGVNDVLDQMTGRVNKIIQDKTRLNNLLSRAPNFLLTPTDLNTTLNASLEVEAGLNDLIDDGFPFPGGGDISLGEVTRCLQIQINLELDAALLLDKAGLGMGFCNLCKFAHLIQGIVDDLIPKFDAQLSFGCDPAVTAGLQANLSNILGTVGADTTTGEITVDSLLAPSLPQLTEDYYNQFKSLVDCCLNITGIVSAVKNFIKDPFSGDPFNIVEFDATIFGKASLGSQDLINFIDPNDAGNITVMEETKKIADGSDPVTDLL